MTTRERLARALARAYAEGFGDYTAPTRAMTPEQIEKWANFNFRRWLDTADEILNATQALTP